MTTPHLCVENIRHLSPDAARLFLALLASQGADIDDEGRFCSLAGINVSTFDQAMQELQALDFLQALTEKLSFASSDGSYAVFDAKDPRREMQALSLPTETEPLWLPSQTPQGTCQLCQRQEVKSAMPFHLGRCLGVWQGFLPRAAIWTAQV